MGKLKDIRKVQEITSLKEAELVLFTGGLVLYLLQSKAITHSEINRVLEESKELISSETKKGTKMRR